MLYTRSTTKSMSDTIINNMMYNRNKLNELQEQISTGKRVSRPSDDPSATISILNSNKTLDKLNVYSNNIDDVKSELEITEQSISTVIDIVHRVRELTVQASNSVNGESELEVINSEVEQLIQQVKDLGNTKFGDKYVFGGLVTDQPPYTNSPFGIQYIGTPDSSTGEHERKAEISEGVEVALNVAGNAIFGEYYYDAGPPIEDQRYGLLNTLETLSLDLETTPPDHDAVRLHLDELEDDLTNLLNNQSKIGGLQSRIDMTQNKIEDDIISYTSFKSEAEDIDLAKAISDLTFQETALNASLQVSARVIQSSILNYV